MNLLDNIIQRIELDATTAQQCIERDGALLHAARIRKCDEAVRSEFDSDEALAAYLQSLAKPMQSDLPRRFAEECQRAASQPKPITSTKLAATTTAAWLNDEQAAQALRLPTTQMMQHPAARRLLADAGVESRKAGRHSVEWSSATLTTTATKLRNDIVAAVAASGVAVDGGAVRIG